LINGSLCEFAEMLDEHHIAIAHDAAHIIFLGGMMVT
jgi:hypothetical protein